MALLLAGAGVVAWAGQSAERAHSFATRASASATSASVVVGVSQNDADAMVGRARELAGDAPGAEIAVEQVTAFELLSLAHVISRADAPVQYVEHSLDALAGRLAPDVRHDLDTLRAGEAWHRVSAGQAAGAGHQAADQLVGLYLEQSVRVARLADRAAWLALLVAVFGGGALIAGAVAAYLAVTRFSGRLAGRLDRLRVQTAGVADVQLPELVARVRAGERVDPAAELLFLDHGDDEIARLADAFTLAQQSAVSAAVGEATSRAGAKHAFAELSWRTQLLLDQQLRTLDEAERATADPAALGLLFDVDHLSTRARRNAENLVVLGDRRPARRWRSPVRLSELVRGAVAEVESYTRVGVGALPDAHLEGAVVVDLVHLLAELLDNAISVSPAETRVEVCGSVAGRGIVLEIEDRGAGMPAARLDAMNALLREPRDFGELVGSGAGVGLFLCGRLAARHGISVTLRGSPYGGTTAIVLVPEAVIADEVLAQIRDQAPFVPSPQPRRIAAKLNGAAR
ncbi:hypothetical protein GCM10009754_23120 [Amycolatopsis minnesotensis]|uniref:histidine kinase n=1 Tax=Amycolatopsis minnesotensis TaxID=337894 RepID=A0ABN2QIZ6_9PSEU